MCIESLAQNTMCHGFEPRDWSREVEDETDEEPADEPSFMKDEPAEDAELLTDGGDEDE